MESVRKRRDFKLTAQQRLLQRWVNKPNFKGRLILNESTGLALIEMGRTKIYLDKFIQAGVTILDISKKVMWDFHYDIMKKMFPRPGQLQLLYTDTDSLVYDIKTPDLYQTLKENDDFFDMSSYPPNHPCFNPKNNKVLGKFKDEVSVNIPSLLCIIIFFLFAMCICFRLREISSANLSHFAPNYIRLKSRAFQTRS